MTTDFLLDTNTAVFLANNHPRVRSRMAQHRPTLLPFVTATELLYGAKRSGRPEHNLREYRLFLSRFRILFADHVTIEIHSDLRLFLERKGKPIPQNDLWQAAIAIRHDAVLVTNDAHFEHLPELRCTDWTT